MTDNNIDNYKDLDSDDDQDVKITMSTRDFSKMTQAERDVYEHNIKCCEFCMSLNRTIHQYNGHNTSECRILAKMRCNFCAELGHTGGHCTKKGPKPLTIRCSFCFRGNKAERFYMSHDIINCRFKSEYDAKKSSRVRYANGKGHNSTHDIRSSSSNDICLGCVSSSNDICLGCVPVSNDICGGCAFSNIAANMSENTKHASKQNIELLQGIQNTNRSIISTLSEIELNK